MLHAAVDLDPFVDLRIVTLMRTIFLTTWDSHGHLLYLEEASKVVLINTDPSVLLHAPT